MQFKTRPTNAEERETEPVPLLRRADRQADAPDSQPDAPPAFVRRERAARVVTRDGEERQQGTAVLRATVGNIWDRLTKAQAWALGLALGLVIGLPLLGWWVWPVSWTDASFNELAPAEAALVIETVADYYAYSEDPVRVAAVLNGWRDGESLVCAMAAQEDDFWTRARLISIAAVRNGRGCE